MTDSVVEVEVFDLLRFYFGDEIWLVMWFGGSFVRFLGKVRSVLVF